MIQSIYVFVASFSIVFLSCIQTINVIRGRHLLAMLTSIASGIASLTCYKIMPQSIAVTDTIAFLAGGTTGSQAAMYITRRQQIKLFRRDKDV